MLHVLCPQDAYIRVLEDERDHFKRECDILNALRTRPVSPGRTRVSVTSFRDSHT